MSTWLPSSHHAHFSQVPPPQGHFQSHELAQIPPVTVPLQYPIGLLIFFTVLVRTQAVLSLCVPVYCLSPLTGL